MPAFQFSVNKQLRSTGLEGTLAWAMIHEGAVQLQDETNHVVRIPFDEIVRLRIGYFDAKRRAYHVRIWRDTSGAPLEVVPTNATWSNYRVTMNELVRQLTERGALDRIETGSSKFDALLGPALMSVPVIGAFAVSLFVLTNEPWWGRMIVPLVPTIILAVLIWMGRQRYWPRTLREVSDLNVHLPPG